MSDTKIYAQCINDVIKGNDSFLVNAEGFAPRLLSHKVTKNINFQTLSFNWDDNIDCDYYGGARFLLKKDSKPKDINDGDIIIDNTELNRYSSTNGVTLDIPVEKGIYYYSIIPFSTTGVYATAPIHETQMGEAGVKLADYSWEEISNMAQEDPYVFTIGDSKTAKVTIYRDAYWPDVVLKGFNMFKSSKDADDYCKMFFMSKVISIYNEYSSLGIKAPADPSTALPLISNGIFGTMVYDTLSPYVKDAYQEWIAYDEEHNKNVHEITSKLVVPNRQLLTDLGYYSFSGIKTVAGNVNSSALTTQMCINDPVYYDTSKSTYSYMTFCANSYKYTGSDPEGFVRYEMKADIDYSLMFNI